MQSKLGKRHDSGSHSMDMDDAPPTSDADVCISATSSASRMGSATVSGGELLFCNFHTSLSLCMGVGRNLKKRMKADKSACITSN